jgi:hypothetical protein
MGVGRHYSGRHSSGEETNSAAPGTKFEASPRKKIIYSFFFIAASLPPFTLSYFYTFLGAMNLFVGIFFFFELASLSELAPPFGYSEGELRRTT